MPNNVRVNYFVFCFLKIEETLYPGRKPPVVLIEKKGKENRI